MLCINAKIALKHNRCYARVSIINIDRKVESNLTNMHRRQVLRYYMESTNWCCRDDICRYFQKRQVVKKLWSDVAVYISDELLEYNFSGIGPHPCCNE